MSYIFR